MQRVPKLDRSQRGAGSAVRAFAGRGLGRSVGLLLLAGLALPTGLAGCGTVGKAERAVTGKPKPPPPLTITDEDLRGGMRDLFLSFALTVEQVSHQIEIEQPDTDGKRRAVSWKIAAVSDMGSTQLSEQAIASFMDAWSFAEQMKQFFSAKGDGATFFGDATHYAMTASAELSKSYEDFAQSFMSPEQFVGARDGVVKFAADHPITGAFARATNRPSAEPKESGYEFGKIISMPLAPFSAFSGIDAGAAAIHEVAQMGTQFASVLATLPRLVQWNLQLVMYDAQSLQELQLTVASLDRFSKSTESLAATAAALPAEADALVTKTMAELADQQGALQATLVDAKAVTADVLATTEALGPRLDQMQALSASLDTTARAVTTTVEAIDHLANPPPDPNAPPKDPDAPPSRPFDILDYQKTAESLTATATEIRGVVDDLNGLIASPALAARLDDVEQRAEGTLTAGGDQLRTTVDRAALRLAQLAGLVFALALAYKGIAGRIARR